MTAEKKMRRKRPEAPGTPVMTRLQPEQLAAVDSWIDEQPDKPSRPEAVRRLIDRGLKRKGGK